jgi:hypothetical protein
MKISIIVLLLACLFEGCSPYHSITEFPSTKLTIKKNNPLADRKVDSLNRYFKEYAPDCYVKFIKTTAGQYLGFCFYLRDTTYPKIQKLLNLPAFTLNEIDDRIKLEQVAAAAANWFWNNVNRKNRMDGVRVVLGTEKGRPYNTYQYCIVQVEEKTPFPGLMKDEIKDEFRYVLGYTHHGYELIRDCFYCF